MFNNGNLKELQNYLTIFKNKKLISEEDLNKVNLKKLNKRKCINLLGGLSPLSQLICCSDYIIIHSSKPIINALSAFCKFNRKEILILDNDILYFLSLDQLIEFIQKEML